MYVADKEATSGTEYAVHETSDQPDTTEFTSTLKQPPHSFQPSPYDVEFPRFLARGGQAPVHLIEDYTEFKGEGQNVDYINSEKHSHSVGMFSPFVKDSYQYTTLQEPQKMKDFFQSTRTRNFYNFNRSFSTTTLANPYKQVELYLPTTSESPYTLRESFQPTVLENLYSIPKEIYQNRLPGNKTDPQEDSRSIYSKSYSSLETKISPEEDSTSHIQKTASSARKHQVATGRETNLYTYFYVGRKLWYVPLFFGAYFIVYLFSLVVRSIARHKIIFPSTRRMSNKRDLSSEQTELEDITQQVTTALETTDRLFL